MLLPRTFGAATALSFATTLFAQTPPSAVPTTGGTGPMKPMVISPTDVARTMPANPSIFPTQAVQLNGVPAALGVNDRQQAQIDTQTQRLQAKFQSQYDRLSGLPAAERTDRLTQLNRDYNSAWLDAARGIFTSEQLTRHQQLQLQHGGFASLTDTVMQKALNLTDAQRTQLQKDIDWSSQQQMAIQQQAQTDQGRALQLHNAYNTAAQTRFNQLLNANQQQAWTQMTGTPFAFQPVFPMAATGTPGATVTGPGGTPRAPGSVTGVGGTPAPPPKVGPAIGGTPPPDGAAPGNPIPGTGPAGIPPKM